MLQKIKKRLPVYFMFSCLFLNAFLLKSQYHQDCEQPFPVCKKQTYFFQDMKGAGFKNDDLGRISCSKHLVETNTKWLKFSIKKTGIITFFIDPIDSKDDIDFILYHKRAEDCSKLQEVRCMAAGENLHEDESFSASCKGTTGLSYQSIDEFEQSGCKYESDNFLKYLSAEAGEEYLLFVNNFNSSQGFSITFDGDAELKELDNCLEFAQDIPIEITSMVPNPAQSYIDIHFRSLNTIPVKIEMFSLEGRRLLEKNTATTKGDQKYTLDLQNISQATYLIRFTQGKYSTIRQFVKI
jgi:hypothetical protein